MSLCEKRARPKRPLASMNGQPLDWAAGVRDHLERMFAREYFGCFFFGPFSKKPLAEKGTENPTTMTPVARKVSFSRSKTLPSLQSCKSTYLPSNISQFRP